MTYRYWPLFDLRLASPDLALRAMTEADLAPIAESTASNAGRLL